MATNFSARLKDVTCGEQTQLVIIQNNEPSAVLIGVDAFQSLCDELEDLRTERVAVERLRSLERKRLVSHEDMLAHFST
ncbi:hypothetical protein D9M68_996100 [compost metagenome]